jgi:phosphate transport system permease protein
MSELTVSKPAALVAGPQRQALMRRRYRVERRFRAYGIVAIGVTAVFLVLLFIDIISKGLPAFTEHRLVMTVTADKQALDPNDTGDPAVIRGGDFDTLIRDRLRNLMPGVTSRSDRKLLLGLLSSGAADDLRAAVVGDPRLLGTEVTVPVLLSDDADQYLKGYQTRIVRRAGQGTLSLAAEGDVFSITTTSGELREALARIKSFASTELARDRRELRLLERRIGALETDLKRAEAAAATGDAVAAATRDRLTADLASLGPNRDALKAAVDELDARVKAVTGAETLNDRLPSLILVANGGYLRLTELGETTAKAEPLLSPETISEAAAGQWSLIELSTPEADRRTSDKEVAWLERLRANGQIERAFAWRFLTSGDSREPELAGIKGALVGSVLTMLVTLTLCLPIGVAAAIYLEEFAPRNRFTEVIEININNLAAVPSIVFGLLGLAMFLNFLGLPRSAPLVGGLVLALLVLPTIIIAARAALKAVPPSIKEAALGVGASEQQAIFHHVLPLAMPGIMTGTIIGLAHALGETAPLLMIGMVAFIVDIPKGITDAATALPVQIYLWSDLPEVAFQAKTAAAIMVLLVFLFVMNALAIYLRKRFERRW